MNSRNLSNIATHFPERQPRYSASNHENLKDAGFHGGLGDFCSHSALAGDILPAGLTDKAQRKISRSGFRRQAPALLTPAKRLNLLKK
jgi:hypothetical protein